MNGNRPHIPERVNLKAAVTVQAPAGLVCGNSLWIIGSQIAIAVDATLVAGDSLEMRLDLGGLYGTARMRVGVMKQLTTAPGEMHRFIMEMFDVAAEDRRRFDAWVGQLEGSSVSDVDLITKTSDIFGGRMEQASEAERAAALRRMERHGSGDRSGQPSGTITDPFGLKSDVGGTGDRRAAMREALRVAAQRRTEPARPGPRAPTPPPREEPRRDFRVGDARPSQLRSDGTRSDATRSGVTRSSDSRSDVTRSDVTRSDVTRSDVTRSNVTHSGVTRSDVSRSEITRSNVTRSEATRSSDSRSAGGRAGDPGRNRLTLSVTPGSDSNDIRLGVRASRRPEMPATTKFSPTSGAQFEFPSPTLDDPSATPPRDVRGEARDVADGRSAVSPGARPDAIRPDPFGLRASHAGVSDPFDLRSAGGPPLSPSEEAGLAERVEAGRHTPVPATAGERVWEGRPEGGADSRAADGRPLDSSRPPDSSRSPDSRASTDSARRPPSSSVDGVRSPASPESHYAVPTAARRPTHTVDPTWRLVPGATPCLEIRWLDHNVWRSDVSQQVVNYILMVSASHNPLPQAPPLDVRLLHATVDVRCPATVLSYGPRGATYRLLLESPQVEALRKASV